MKPENILHNMPLKSSEFNKTRCYVNPIINTQEECKKKIPLVGLKQKDNE